MLPQSGDGSRGGLWGVQGSPSPDLEELLRQDRTDSNGSCRAADRAGRG